MRSIAMPSIAISLCVVFSLVSSARPAAEPFEVFELELDLLWADVQLPPSTR
jgi:hypothetical protein